MLYLSTSNHNILYLDDKKVHRTISARFSCARRPACRLPVVGLFRRRRKTCVYALKKRVARQHHSEIRYPEWWLIFIDRVGFGVDPWILRVENDDFVPIMIELKMPSEQLVITIPSVLRYSSASFSSMFNRPRGRTRREIFLWRCLRCFHRIFQDPYCSVQDHKEDSQERPLWGSTTRLLEKSPAPRVAVLLV